MATSAADDADPGRLCERLAGFARTQERMRALLGAMLSASGELELAVVLRRIVATAMELVGARYGALGALDEEGAGLADFIPVGLDDAERARLEGVALPHGEGLPGLLISDRSRCAWTPRPPTPGPRGSRRATRRCTACWAWPSRCAGTSTETSSRSATAPSSSSGCCCPA
ncbi:hypothetical protein ACMATS_35115 [Streptoverticillium reticulum]|uniref:hypothetical protein n=1 Tax=Streptoverticillium reticulum TaxID=1433415 RepID=UPI0039BFA78A